MGNYRRRMFWPSIFSDPHFQKIRRAARLLFIAHVLAADDEGRGDLGPEDFKSFAFSQDEDISEETIEAELLPTLWKVKKRKGRALVEPYEVGENLFWYLPKWLSYQTVDKPTASKLPDPSHGKRPGEGRPTVNKKNGRPPTLGQWELLQTMSLERGTTLAKVVANCGIASIDAVLARDVTRLRQALEKIDPLNGKNEEALRADLLFRPISFAIQVGDLEEAARLMGAVDAGDWSKVRGKIRRLCSSYSGSTPAEVFESIRRSYG